MVWILIDDGFAAAIVSFSLAGIAGVVIIFPPLISYLIMRKKTNRSKKYKIIFFVIGFIGLTVGLIIKAMRVGNNYRIGFPFFTVGLVLTVFGLYLRFKKKSRTKNNVNI